MGNLQCFNGPCRLWQVAPNPLRGLRQIACVTLLIVAVVIFLIVRRKLKAKVAKAKKTGSTRKKERLEKRLKGIAKNEGAKETEQTPLETFRIDYGCSNTSYGTLS